MSFGPAGYDRNDSGCAEFRALFNCPFHTVKFENGKSERQIGSGGLIYFFTPVQFKPHRVFSRNAPPPGAPPRGGFSIFCPPPTEGNRPSVWLGHPRAPR